MCCQPVVNLLVTSARTRSKANKNHTLHLKNNFVMILLTAQPRGENFRHRSYFNPLIISAFYSLPPPGDRISSSSILHIEIKALLGNLTLSLWGCEKLLKKKVEKNLMFGRISTK